MMHKTIVTFMMWTVAALFSGIILVLGWGEDSYSFTEFAVLFGLPLVCAMLGTMPVWAESGNQHEASHEKPKRQQTDKMALLMDLMTPDEREAFKEALKRQVLAEASYVDDGELPLDYQAVESMQSQR